ncbi:hypothetical protein XENOCAPTIV_022400, partial [Xenoophorus captivus]
QVVKPPRNKQRLSELSPDLLPSYRLEIRADPRPDIRRVPQTFSRLMGTLRTAYLGCSVVHHLFGGQVALVADQQLVDVLAGVAVDLLQPLLDVVEGLLWMNTNALNVRRRATVGMMVPL